MAGLFGKNRKQTAAVFVDYEHWYFSYQNKFNMKPNVEEWFDELKKEYHVKDIRFYGDFNGYGLEKEYQRIDRLTKNVYHTASTKDGVDKDFTDFYILDAIYRTAVGRNSPEVFIIFTGDGHFNLAVKYLREKGKKVIIYGVKYSLSNKLKASANSYVEMPRSNQEQQFYFNIILNSLKTLQENNKMATYWKTITNVSERCGISQDRIQHAMDDLICKKYVTEEEYKYKGSRPRLLVVDWDRLKTDGLWES